MTSFKKWCVFKGKDKMKKTRRNDENRKFEKIVGRVHYTSYTDDCERSPDVRKAENELATSLNHNEILRDLLPC